MYVRVKDLAKKYNMRASALEYLVNQNGAATKIVDNHKFAEKIRSIEIIERRKAVLSAPLKNGYLKSKSVTAKYGYKFVSMLKNRVTRYNLNCRKYGENIHFAYQMNDFLTITQADNRPSYAVDDIARVCRMTRDEVLERALSFDIRVVNDRVLNRNMVLMLKGRHKARYAVKRQTFSRSLSIRKVFKIEGKVFNVFENDTFLFLSNKENKVQHTFDCIFRADCDKPKPEEVKNITAIIGGYVGHGQDGVVGYLNNFYVVGYGF